MAAIFAFKCKQCGNVHEGSPSFGYDAPWNYSALDEDDKAQARLTPDTCEIDHEDGTDRFIRVVLEVPIHGAADPFTWGVWVSLSEKSFTRYVETYDDPDESDEYFGWFCNRLPYYENTINLKTSVHPRGQRQRPYIDLERGGHLLAEHQCEGISIEQAQEIAEYLMHIKG